MKLWLAKSFYDFFFIVIHSILFLSAGKFCLNTNIKNEINENNLNSNAIINDKPSENNLNNKNTFDFSFQKSFIPKKKLSVEDLIFMNFEKNKKKLLQKQKSKDHFIINTTTKDFQVNILKQKNEKKSVLDKKEIDIKNDNNNSQNKLNEQNNPHYEISKNEKKDTSNNKENSKEKNFFLSIFENNYNNDNSKSKNFKGGFFNEFATSFSLNFFSEIGDKSFIAVFLFTNQASWITLFLVASTTEIIVNLVSVIIGYNLRAYESIYFILIYITIFTTLLFGILLLKEAIYDTEDEEILNEKIDCEKAFKNEKNYKNTEDNKGFIFLILKIFWVVFLTELGDKSQFVTIILSTHHAPIPVFLGTAVAHVLGVLLSILLGNIVSSKLSNRIMNFIAAGCFIGYALFVSVSYFFDNKSSL